MSHLFIEFRDFEYINRNGIVSVSEKVVITVYVKVLGKNEEYLGSLNLGLYNNYEGEKLKKCINDVICQNFPEFKSYESVITKL
ncbi:MAG: hypothetical protein PHI48_13450 [Bacteroidales bacterium]|nr:hypothetical protein [Bacteroidales bacterium]